MVYIDSVCTSAYAHFRDLSTHMHVHKSTHMLAPMPAQASILCNTFVTHRNVDEISGDERIGFECSCVMKDGYGNEHDTGVNVCIETCIDVCVDMHVCVRHARV